VGRSARLAIVGLFLVAAGLGGYFTVRTLQEVPPTVAFTPDASGQVDVSLQTVGSYGSGPHPTWVSYLVQSPTTGQWVHTTLWQVPADTQVNVTIYQYDSGSPLRNQQLGQVTGTIGGVAKLNGKPFSVFNSNSGNGVGHTFSIPTLGISVPLVGNSSTANLCAAAPCSSTNTSYPHNTLTFSFMSPKATGSYPWQCFVPCGLGWLYGNGGPMSTVGFMGGFMQVV
jgi:hypothetical protein